MGDQRKSSIFRMNLILQCSILLALCSVVSCSKTPWLKVRTEYYDQKQLASVAVDTPDPKKEHAVWGQRLLIQWDICSGDMSSQKLLANTKTPNPETPHPELSIRIRLKNGDEKRETRTLHGTSGLEYFTIDAYDYSSTGGILSYTIELSLEGTLIKRSSHRLWVEPIGQNRQKLYINK